MQLEKDLASYNKPISSLFNWPKTAQEWEQYKLSDAQIEHFHKHGYVADIKVLELNHIEQLKKELKEIMNPNSDSNELLYEFHTNESEDPDRLLFHSLGHWRATVGFHDVLWNPAFIMPAYQLLGEKGVRFWHDQLFCKPAKHGGVVAWHQDYSYWTRTTPMQHLTCWTGLDDATTENGCLQYIPGSHQWGLLNKPSLTGEMHGLNEFLNKEQQDALKNPTFVELKKGHASFHHPLLVHGSSENDSEKKRRAFVLNVFADETLSDSNEVSLAGVPPIKKGDKMEGKFFPLLMDSSSFK